MPPVGSRLALLAVIGTALLLSRPAAAGQVLPQQDKQDICDLDADLALGVENYRLAIALHRKVLRAHEGHALAHYHLGFAYGMTGRYRDEIKQYVVAAKLGLRRWDLFVNLGLAYLDRGDVAKATKALRKAVSLGSSHPEAHFSLAIAYQRAGKLRAALQQIDASLRLAPDGRDERNTKAIICVQLGDLACARKEWRRLVKMAPDYVPGRVNLQLLDGAQRSRGRSAPAAAEGELIQRIEGPDAGRAARPD